VRELIYHITSRSAWIAAKDSGAYSADSLSSQGFIHCSRTEQILRVAGSFYAGQHGLVILAIDPARLTPQVRWEPGTDKPDELFPHVYGRIGLEAVVHVFDFEPQADGAFTLPAGLA
jgi:uncharacterized protein (DUF952 family)